MARRKKKKAPKKPSLYRELSKRFTAINNSLPEPQRISIHRRRQIIKQVLLPSLSTTPYYKIRWRPVKAQILAEVAKMPQRDPSLCNINNITPDQYSLIEWFEIDETLQRLLPDCIYVRVSAGSFGQTKIFNTRDYNYYNKGVQEITENIRPYVNNESGTAFYNGFQKLRPRKKNDGQADSYFLDFILYIASANETPSPVTPIGNMVKYTPKTKEEKRAAKKATLKTGRIIDKAISKLKKEKDAKRRAGRQIRKDEATIKGIVDQGTSKSGVKETMRTLQFGEKTERAINKLNKYLSKGLVTKSRYDKAMKNIKDSIKKFNK